MNPLEIIPPTPPTSGRLDLSRRRVVQAAAWSVPAVTLATAAPAFAASPVAGPETPVAFTSALFWRPLDAELSFMERMYWGQVPVTTIMWMTSLTNTGPSVLNNVQLSLSVPLGNAANRGFQIIDAGGLATVPQLNVLTDRSASGVTITLSQVPANTPQTLSVAIAAPSTLARATPAAWPLTVTPPGAGTTISVPFTTYAEFRKTLGA